jgi:hypothetical protein
MLILPKLLWGCGTVCLDWCAVYMNAARRESLKFTCTTVYPNVSGLAAWSEDCKFIAICIWVQLYRYFVSHYSEFFRHKSLHCFSTSSTKGKRVFLCRFSPETFEYTLLWKESHVSVIGFIFKTGPSYLFSSLTLVKLCIIYEIWITFLIDGGSIMWKRK